MRDGGFAIALSALILCSCTTERSTLAIVQYQDQVIPAQYDQIRRQLLRSVAHPYTIPSLTMVGQATIKATGNVQAAATRTVAPSGISETFGFSAGAIGSEASLNVSTNTSPKALQVMRDLYSSAALGQSLWRGSDYEALLNKPPTGKWLVSAVSGRPAECGQTCLRLGDVRGISYWAREEKDYYDFALAVIEASTFKAATNTTEATPPPGTPKPPQAGSAKPAPRGNNNFIYRVPNAFEFPLTETE